MECVRGERGKGAYDTPSKSKEYRQPIQRDHNDAAQRTDEIARYADESDDEQPDAEEDFVVCDRGRAAVGLGFDEVRAQAEDHDGEEYLECVGQYSFREDWCLEWEGGAYFDGAQAEVYDVYHLCGGLRMRGVGVSVGAWVGMRGME